MKLAELLIERSELQKRIAQMASRLNDYQGEAMITNEAFMLNDEELARYNEWAEKIAQGMGDADIESWTLNVTFSFSNLGTPADW